MTIGKMIRDLRIEKDMTQAELGKEIGVSQKAIDYWERDVYEPKFSSVLELIKYFDLDLQEFLDELLEGEEDDDFDEDEDVDADFDDEFDV